MKHKALIIGDDTRSFLATVRSLGRGDVEVHVAPYSFNAPALASRYIAKVHRLPYYLDGGAEWLQAMAALLASEKFDLVIPCEERSLLPLHLHREQLAPLARLAIPDEAGMAAFFDKARTRALATECGVPVTAGQLIAPDTTAAALINQLGLPLIVKPRHSYDWPELYVRSSAQLISTQTSLTDWLAQHRDTRDHYLAERVFPGAGLGLSVLCAEGKVVLAFEHYRVHEEFGSSFYRRSAPLNPARLTAVKAMVAAVGYSGLAMFEFRENPDDGQWILLEVNARPWGSLPLPVALGVDFPLALFRMQVDGELPTDKGYAAECYCRNLLSDFWQLRKNLATHALLSLSTLTSLSAWLWSFRRIFMGKEHNDLWVSDDSAPARRELRGFVNERLQAIRFRLFGPRNNDTPPTAGEGATVLFICQGNICRSPYAEYKLRKLLGPSSNINVISAGMLPRNRRPSPSQAISAAADLDVDLSSHRSQVATDAMIEAADMILIFDRINEHSLYSRHPAAQSKTRLLDADGEVADPDGKDIATFSATYKRVNACLKKLAAELASAAKPHA